MTLISFYSDDEDDNDYNHGDNDYEYDHDDFEDNGIFSCVHRPNTSLISFYDTVSDPRASPKF